MLHGFVNNSTEKVQQSARKSFSLAKPIDAIFKLYSMGNDPNYNNFDTIFNLILHLLSEEK